MDLWGNEEQKLLQQKPLNAVKKSKPTEQEQKKEQFVKDHIDELSEDSSPKAWLVQFRRLQDEVKSLKIVHSEMKEIREYISRNERRCGECVKSINALSTDYSEQFEMIKIRVNSLEDFAATANDFFKKIDNVLDNVLGEDDDSK